MPTAANEPPEVPPSYVVTSENFAGGALGSVVTEADLANCNIAALIEAGHLALAT